MAEDIKFRHTMPVQIRFSDVDQFGHMNNSVYFSLYDLAKTTYIKDVFGSADWSKLAIVVANINANFFMPVFFSDHLVIETAVVHLGHKSFTLLQRAVTTDTHEVKCECRTVMVGYDLATKEPKLISEDYKKAICRYEEKTLEELSKERKELLIFCVVDVLSTICIMNKGVSHDTPLFFYVKTSVLKNKQEDLAYFFPYPGV